MLIEIVFKCHGEDILPKVKKFTPEDRQWFEKKCFTAIDKGAPRPHHIEMNLEEAVRMLTAFNGVEEIDFIVK